MATDTMLSDWYSSYMKANPKVSTYKPEQAVTTNWNVGRDQTVKGQLADITAKGSPLMTLADTRSRQQMARRGMLNSSMAVQAGQAALYDAAMPIAQADAATYGRAGEFNATQANENSRFNTAEANKAGMFGADWSNRFTENAQKLAGERGLQSDRLSWETGENAAQRTWQSGENTAERGWKSGEADKDRTFTAGENQKGREFQTSERLGAESFTAGQNTAERDWRSAEAGKDREFTAAEAQKGRDFQTSERIAQQDFGATEAEKNRNFEAAQTAQQHANELERLGYANKLATASVPGQFAATVSQTTMAQVGAIMADPNLDPEAKKNAIQNVVDYANSTLSWAESFYAVSLPEIMPPGQQQTPVMGPQPTVASPVAPTVDPIATP